MIKGAFFVMVLLGWLPQLWAQNFVQDRPGEIRVSMHTKSPSPDVFDSPKHKGKIHCSRVYREMTYLHKNQNVGDMGSMSIQNREFPESYQPWEIHGLIERVLAFWESTGFYTKKQIQWLFEREMSLPAIRTHFVEIVHEGKTLAIRIFDGSTQVWADPLPWYGIHRGDHALTPTERTYGIKFIERVLLPEDAYILDLGLLGSPKEFINGVDAAFENVAQWIDTHYNYMNYRTFGDVSLIESRNLQIYGVARPKLAEHYEAFGFDQLKIAGPNGPRPVQFDDGMILIKISGADFIKRHLKGRTFPEVDGRPPITSEIWITPEIKELNRELEGFGHVQGLKDMGDFWEVWNQIIHTYDPIFRNAPEGSQEAAQTYRTMIEFLYQLYKSPVYHENNHPAAAIMKVALLKQLLTTPPEQGWGILHSFLINLEVARYHPEAFDWVTFDKE